MKATIGAVDISSSQSDGNRLGSVGGMTKCTEDLAVLMSTLLPDQNLSRSSPTSWDGISVAVIDHDTWQFPEAVCEKVEHFEKQIVRLPRRNFSLQHH